MSGSGHSFPLLTHHGLAACCLTVFIRGLQVAADRPVLRNAQLVISGCIFANLCVQVRMLTARAATSANVKSDIAD